MIHNEQSARQYIADKRLQQLSQVLTTAIAHEKPDNPVDFLLKVVTDLKQARDSNGSVLVCFEQKDIKAMFSVMDPFNKGKVSREQLEGALKNFGTEPDLIPQVLGSDQGPFGIEDFEKYINQGVRQTLFPSN